MIMMTMMVMPKERLKKTKNILVPLQGKSTVWRTLGSRNCKILFRYGLWLMYSRFTDNTKLPDWCQTFGLTDWQILSDRMSVCQTKQKERKHKMKWRLHIVFIYIIITYIKYVLSRNIIKQVCYYILLDIIRYRNRDWNSNNWLSSSHCLLPPEHLNSNHSCHLYSIDNWFVEFLRQSLRHYQ